MEKRKVVYNACFGGFSLSEKAVLLGRELSGDPTWGGVCLVGDTYFDGEVVGIFYGGARDVDRTDKTLIAVVEKLGTNASGDCADLRIATVFGKYRIDEYDGNEQVMTSDDYDWK